MKECKRFEKLLVGYLHGELYEREYYTLRAHLESCAACRAELEAQRVTLELLGEALEAAPAPVRLTAWRRIPRSEVNIRQNVFARIWFSPQFKATLAAGVLASFFFFFSGIFVVYRALPKAAPEFSPPPPVQRPKTMLKKPTIRLGKEESASAANKRRMIVDKSVAPKPSSRIVAKVKTAPQPAIELPELMGAGEGLLGGNGGASGSTVYFDSKDSWALTEDLRRGSAVAQGVDQLESEANAERSYGLDESLGIAPVPEVALNGSSATFEYGARFQQDGKKDHAGQYTAYNLWDREALASESQVAQTTAPAETLADMAMIEDRFGEPFADSAQEHSMVADTSLMGNEKMAFESVTSGVMAPMKEPAEVEDLFGDSTLSSESALGYSTGGALAQNKPAPAPDAGETAKGVQADEVAVQIEAKFVEFNGDAFDGEWQERVGTRQKEAVREAEVTEEEWLPDSGDRSLKPQRREPAVFNPYVMAAENPFSTFSIDVDTASFSLARQQLLAGALPETEAVRTEEFINSFDYDYRPPAGTQTFAVHREMAPSPFRTRMDLLKIGVKGRRIGRDDHRGAVLTLVVDTSGSMSTPERLGLVKRSLALLIDQLNPDDELALIQFGGEARLVLEHTPASKKDVLLNAINSLQAGGPTQFDKGLELGYRIASEGYEAGDSNRIIVMSDGVANLGELDPDAILEQVADFRTKGIYLSVLGFGAGTYDDDLLERLANRGDGTYAYVDSLDEARHLFVDQLAATLHTIASDVKIQVEFNPSRVLRYRQLGYENRQLTKEQFRDDTVDAGEVGSGQSVTALYDVELKPDGSDREPIATVYVRYRRADNGAIEEISSRVMDTARLNRFEETDPRFQLAACVAEFAERLRRSPYTEGTEMKDILVRLQPVAMALNLDGQVQELLRLIAIAQGLEN